MKKCFKIVVENFELSFNPEYVQTNIQKLFKKILKRLMRWEKYLQKV